MNRRLVRVELLAEALFAAVEAHPRFKKLEHGGVVLRAKQPEQPRDGCRARRPRRHRRVALHRDEVGLGHGLVRHGALNNT